MLLYEAKLILNDSKLSTSIDMIKKTLNVGKKVGRKVGVNTGILKPKPAELVQKINKYVDKLDNNFIKLDADDGENIFLPQGLSNRDYIHAKLNWDKKGVRRFVGANRALSTAATAMVLNDVRRIASKKEKPKTRLEKIKDVIKDKLS